MTNNRSRERPLLFGEMQMAAFSFSTVAAVRGHHIYIQSWKPSTGDLVTFKRHNAELQVS